MNNLDKQYQELLQDILDNGVTKSDRTGTGTISVFGRQIRHKMSEGFPLLTTKKMAWKTMVTELLWFLRGDTNIKYLVDNNCHIWDGDAYNAYEKAYENGKHLEGTGLLWMVKETKETFIYRIKTDDEFAKKWGDLGPVYGKQWRSWRKWSGEEVLQNFYEAVIDEIDQIQNLINDLKTNPDSRRLMVNAWNVGELDQMVLPPCHYGFQVYTRELSLGERKKLANYDSEFVSPMTVESWDRNNIPTRAISLMFNMRSVDTFLGLPFNIASYGLLLEIIAKEVNMIPDELIGNLGDVHLYSNHIEQAKEQIGRELTLGERTECWFETKPNRQEREDVGDSHSRYQEKYFDNVGVPKRTREPYPLPTLNIKLHFNNEPSFVPEHWLVDDFEIVNYQSHPVIKAPLSN